MRGRSLRRARTIGGLIGVLMAGIVAAAILGGSSYAYPLSFSGSATDTNLSFLSASPTISSDQPDYFPGSTVTLTGTGWDSGESVQLFVNDDEGKTWSYSADVVADSSGEFTLRFDLPTTFVSLYQVTATGATSGTARTSFTDGNVTAATIAVRKSDCTTAGTSFILGDVACAHSSITTISGNQVGDAFVQWVNPSNTVASTVTHANASQGDSFNDSFTPNAAGTWTVKVCSNNSCNANQTLDSKTFTVVSDTTPPTVTVTTPAVPGGQAGFFNATQAPVTVSVSADDVSGVTNLSCTDNGSPVTVGGQAGSSPRTGSFQLSSDGTHSVVCVATDGFSPANTGAAGGSSNTATVKIDATAPSVNLTFGRTPDHAGWYTSSVLISASGTDGGSGINNCTSAAYGGPDNASASVTRSCTDNAGNSASASSTIKYDETGPSATLSVSAGTPGANGWYTSNVTVHTAGSDAVSGPVTCTGDQLQSTETSGHTFNGSCTNDAGLTTNASALTIELDKTAPTAVSLAVTAGTEGSNGWYTSDVTLHTSGSEDISGPLTCTGDQHQTSETTGTLFNGSCANDAGLTTNAIAKTIKLDKTGPSASLAVTDGTLGNNGWYITDVTIGTSGEDAISSPVSCTAAQHQTTDTAGTDFHGSCTNDAGLGTNAIALTIKRDHTNPSVSLLFDRAPDHNGWYTSAVLISGDGTDGASGIASCQSSSYGGPDTAGGSVTRSCEDNAGNVGSASGTIKYDGTGPSAALSVSAGALGTNDWYTSDVTIHASGSDAVSGPVTCSDDQHQTAETTGATFNASCTNDAGLSTPAVPLTVRLDKSGPSAAMSVTAGLAGANDWYTSDVTVHTAGSDAISGNVICTTDQFQTVETAGHEFQAACTNDAGLPTQADPLTIKLDKTAPSADLSVTAGDLGSNGWYTSDVTLKTSGADSISEPVVCSPDQFQDYETTGQLFGGMCVNDAGLPANATGITIKLDKTGPSAAMSVTAGLAGANDWYTSDVTVHTAGSDAISGNVICTTDQFQTVETAGHEFQAACTNDAGLPTQADPLTIKLDKTAPSADLSVTAGDLGSNGWYTSDVTLKTSGADSISGPVVCSPDQFQDYETTGQLFGGMCVNDAGLGANATGITIKLDKTGPSADLAVTAGTAGSNGWYTSDVTLSTTGADDISGLASCTGDQHQTAETAGAAFNGACANNAGLTTHAASVTVKLDKSGPSATLSAAGTHGSNGWFTSDVTISTSGADDVSGPVTCSGDQYQNDETIGTIFNGSCTNGAGLSTNAIALSVKLDKTGPTAALSVTSGTLGNNGWYTSNVTVHTAGADSISSPTVSCTPDQQQLTETAGQLFNGSCTNDAGLTTNASALTVKVDKTAPTISSANDGQSYALGSSQTASFSCSDPGTLAGLNTCDGTVANPSPLSTTPVGPHSYGVSASDNAGNTSSKTVNYTVGYRYDGFLQPINDTAHQTGLFESKFKLGSTVPVKFQLKTDAGSPVQAGSLPGFSYKRIGSSCDSLTDTEAAVAADVTNGSTFRWDASLQGYIYNFSSKSLTAGEYRVYASMDDESTQTVDLCMTR